MTSPARQKEADRVELVYYWALYQIAYQARLESLSLWQEVPATKQAANSATWLKAAVAAVLRRRSKARRLGLAYYRLVRALRTGHSIVDPDRDEAEGDAVTLDDLRDQFDELVDEIEDEGVIETPVDAQQDDDGAQPQSEPDDLSDADSDRPADDDGTDKQVFLDLIKELDAQDAVDEQEAEDEATELLDQLGVENLLDKLEELDAKSDETATSDTADADRATVHDIAGKRQAATAERIAMNASRGLAYNLGEYDARVIGWARFSTTGHPCGFCAMLISRACVYKDGRVSGEGVLYSTRKASGSSMDSGGNPVDDSDRYHDGCHCVAVPIFDISQVSSPMFAQNQELAQLWAEQVGGTNWTKRRKSDDDTQMTVWRRLFRERKRAAQNTTAAPVAA